jgi:hypothetical protein
VEFCVRQKSIVVPYPGEEEEVLLVRAILHLSSEVNKA